MLRITFLLLINGERDLFLYLEFLIFVVYDLVQALSIISFISFLYPSKSSLLDLQLLSSRLGLSLLRLCHDNVVLFFRTANDGDFEKFTIFEEILN